MMAGKGAAQQEERRARARLRTPPAGMLVLGIETLPLERRGEQSGREQCGRLVPLERLEAAPPHLPRDPN
jgi:hypothetical protein